MKTKLTQYLMAALLGIALTSNLHAQSSAFTYQGQLTANGSPVSGIYDLQFTMYDADSGGSALAGPLTNSAVPVSSGVFTVALDFGPGVFDGVALAAIQGLNQKTEDRIQKLEAENAELHQELQEIKKLLSNLTTKENNQ